MKRSIQTMLAIAMFCWSSITVATEAPMRVEGAKTVDLYEARMLHDSGAVFIDVRDQDSWSFGHITGSVNLDLTRDEFVILYSSPNLDRDTPIVFYSDSSLTSKGAMASFFAANWGYKNVHFFRGGYYTWMASDFPIDARKR